MNKHIIALIAHNITKIAIIKKRGNSMKIKHYSMSLLTLLFILVGSTSLYASVLVKPDSQQWSVLTRFNAESASLQMSLEAKQYIQGANVQVPYFANQLQRLNDVTLTQHYMSKRHPNMFKLIDDVCISCIG